MSTRQGVQALVVAVRVILIMVGLHGNGLLAQTPPTIPFPPQLPLLPEEPLPSTPPPSPLLPPVAPKAPEGKAPPLRLYLAKIALVGNTVFTEQQLASVTNQYVNRELTAEDIEALRLALTVLYVDRGYVTSGAIIPEQVIKDKTLIVQIVEGKLSNIDVQGNKWLWPGYVRNRILRGANPPLNVNALQERLQFLQRDPRIERINAELKPGVAQGESTLDVRIKETSMFRAFLDFNNYQSPSVGAERGLMTVEDLNLTRFGDSLSFQYGRSKGVDPIINTRYAIPLNAYETTLFAQYRKSAFAVQSQPFQLLDIRNNAQIYTVGLSHPLIRTLQHEFTVSVVGEYEENKSTLLGQPFEFVAGATNGVFRVSALRLLQEYVYRTTQQVISMQSRFSIGIDTLGATPQGNTPQAARAQFFSWLGQAQWVHQFQTLRAQLLTRTTLQLASTHLFPLEEIAVGGRYSVRGYREYTFVRDNGLLASVEIRIPLYTTADGIDRIRLAPFTDFGRAWNTSVPTGDRDTLASVGIGLLATIMTGTSFEVYWGQQLDHLRLGRGNLQDHGVHLQLVVQIF